MFDAIGNHRTLQVIQGRTAEEVLAIIKAIPLPVKIVAIYALGTRHYAWINTSVRIKKKPSAQVIPADEGDPE